MLSQDLKRDDVEYLDVRRREDDERSGAIEVGTQPVSCSDAPAVAWSKPGEVILRHRSNQVVSDLKLVLEKLFRDDGANCMAAEILRSRGTTSISKKACHWIRATELERTSENVEIGHTSSIADPHRPDQPPSVRFSEWSGPVGALELEFDL